MDQKQRKKAAKQFAENWQGRGYEKGDSQIFWSELLRDVLGMTGISGKCKFEHHTDDGGFIDCWIPDSGVIIEQKSLGIDLDKPEERQGRMVTPFEQALAYVESFRPSLQPRFIITCNFGTFRTYDRESCSRADLPKTYVEFTLDEFADSPHLLDFITKPENSRAEKEKQISMQAGEQIGQIFELLREQYIDPDSPESAHALNVLCVRLVFCLFCEDAGLFEKDALLDYLRHVPPENLRRALRELFIALNTPVEERDPYDRGKFKGFPYVNGGLFADEIEIPNFTEDIKFKLLFNCSQQIDWSKISPTIFGGIFESTLNPETRRSGGMHYTSPENIHKVIDPLFLDDLRAEFNEIRFNEKLVGKKRKQALSAFRSKIGSLRFLDPACGSGNFLTETYLCLRELENDVLNEMNDGQMSMLFGDEIANDEHVTLDQFYGIEINDFACRVARTALWIAQLQANNNSEMLLDMTIEDFPLSDCANIVEGNALRIDWNEILPASECNYIMGNPPFIGYSNHTPSQQEDRTAIFGKGVNNVDYVSCWYLVSARYTRNYDIRCAFVSTNSICQGQQVKAVWDRVFAEGIHIDFAWRTFVWNSEATDQAHVHVVIVGFSRHASNKVIYDEHGIPTCATNINGYLEDKPNVSLERRSKPLCDVPPMIRGCQPTDDGNLILSPEERDELLKKEPAAEPWIRPFSMGAEFINGKERYCLWLVGISPKELRSMPEVSKRVAAVKEMRLGSKKKATQKKAETAWLFDEIRPPKGEKYLAFPTVSSGRRTYIPLGFVNNGMIPGNKLYYIDDASMFVFGILCSRFHNAWVRSVAGRLKSDFNYSNTVVYNNFIWPDCTDVQKATIESCAQALLDARELYPNDSLADLYDPDLMPIELRRAHKALDAAVEAAYGVNFNDDEKKIVAYLFKLHAEKTGAES